MLYFCTGCFGAHPPAPTIDGRRRRIFFKNGQQLQLQNSFKGVLLWLCAACKPCAMHKFTTSGCSPGPWRPHWSTACAAIVQCNLKPAYQYNINIQAAFQISGASLLSHFTCELEFLCVLCIAMTVSLWCVSLCNVVWLFNLELWPFMNHVSNPRLHPWVFSHGAVHVAIVISSHGIQSSM